MRPLQVEYFIDAAAKVRFRVRGGNYEIMCQSEGYETLASARHAVDVLTGGLPTARVEYLWNRPEIAAARPMSSRGLLGSMLTTPPPPNTLLGAAMQARERR